MITKVVTDIEMREIDRISIEETGIPAAVLMNNAGKAIAQFIENNFKDRKISIFCGSGNNGGDGFTAAYYLSNNGNFPEIYLSGKKEKVSETSKIFVNLCEKMNVKINEIDNSSISAIDLPADGVIIDAVLGTGSIDSPKGMPYEFIKIINKSRNTIVSVDVPSGLSSNGEKPAGECVNADFTITLGLPKISLVTYPGKSFCGEIIVEDIGFPAFLTSDNKLKVALIDDALFKTIRLFNNEPDIHKGDKGHTLLIGGFTGMEGAVILTSSALFTSGCGLLTIASESGSREIIAGIIPEAMTVSLPDDADLSELENLFKTKKFTSMIIGPGLGRSSYSESIFKNTIQLLNNSEIKRVLIDGDGLFHLADFLKSEKLPENIEFIITPHFMEASRILKKDIDTIKGSRLASCIELAKQTGCIAVLKGPASIISDGDISYINTTGNPGLATAGSGDVLSGIIGSFMNMNIIALEAAAAGVFIHGLCADAYAGTSVVSTMSATDIVKNIRPVLKLKSNPEK